MPGAQCARSRVCSVERTRVSHHGHTGNARHSPRNGFNGFLRALPGDRLVCHRRWQIIANLTPASRRQDHTTSPSAAAPFVCVSRAEDPIAPMLPRPPHPCPTFVTIAKRPSVGRDGVGSRSDLGQARNGIFLREGLDRLMSDLPVGQNHRPVRQQDCMAD
jgi:hypothetical protein